MHFKVLINLLAALVAVATGKLKISTTLTELHNTCVQKSGITEEEHLAYDIRTSNDYSMKIFRIYVKNHDFDKCLHDADPEARKNIVWKRNIFLSSFLFRTGFLFK
ncbi:uncharacterized protein LOC132696237 [Cylas formicarius]|uniref:uncharacterized protein LOC132696237 n=1 Tax=Cylas formicarius TaxID=197179 RepID=UPI002958976A|nr:uncharacterized protein LOC132696237 [Cylas formicarius]